MLTGIRLVIQIILRRPIIYGCWFRSWDMPEAFEVMSNNAYIANNHFGWKVILLPLLQKHLSQEEGG